MSARSPVTLSNENGLSRSRPSPHTPPAASARHEAMTAARRLGRW